MNHPNPVLPQTTGADLRALRKTRGLTLSDLADRLGRSVGWLSQVERDKSVPTKSDLRHLAEALEVSLSMLVRQGSTPSHEADFIVRRDARRPVGSHVPGLVEELLSPDLTDDFEMVHSTFEPGSGISERVTRATQEVAYLISGRLNVQIDSSTHVIEPGDSFRIRGEAFRWSNPYDVPAVAIWVIAPPVY